jgi:hypothetical protein
MVSSVCLGVKPPSGAQDQIFITIRQLCVCSLTATQSQSQSYVMTDGQLASLSRCQAPFWGPRPDFCYCQTVVGWLMLGAFSDKMTGVLFTIACGPCQHSTSPVELMTIFYCFDSTPLYLGGPGPCI